MLKTKNLKKNKNKTQNNMRNQEKYIYRIYIEGHTYKNFKNLTKKNTQNICEKRMYAQRKA